MNEFSIPPERIAPKATSTSKIHHTSETNLVPASETISANTTAVVAASETIPFNMTIGLASETIPASEVSGRMLSASEKLPLGKTVTVSVTPPSLLSNDTVRVIKKSCSQKFFSLRRS